MSLAWRLYGDRNIAASYRGEARRLLFHLNNIQAPSPVDVAGFRRSYPDGTEIIIQKIGDQEIINIKAVPPVVAPSEGEESLGDLIIFYKSKPSEEFPDGEKRVCVTTPKIFEGDPPDMEVYQATKWGMTFNAENLRIIGKQFTYKTKSVWYYRLPFTLRTPDPYTDEGHYLFSGFSSSWFVDYLYVEATAKWFQIRENTALFSPFNVSSQYIYLVVGSTAYAYDFNFDTETMTLVSSRGSCPIPAQHIDTTGKVYGPKKTVTWLDSDPDVPGQYGVSFVPEAISGIGWRWRGYHFTGPPAWEAWDVWTLDGAASEIGRLFGDYSGYQYFDPWNVRHGRWVDISLYSVAAWDMWTGAETLANNANYETSASLIQTGGYNVAPYPWNITDPPVYTPAKAYQTFTHYPSIARIAAGVGISHALYTEKKETWESGEGALFSYNSIMTEEIDPRDWPFPGWHDARLYTINKTMSYGYREVFTRTFAGLSLVTDAAQDVSGSLNIAWGTIDGTTSNASMQSAIYSGHVLDAIEFLAYPLGSTPFGKYTLVSRDRNVGRSWSLGPIEGYTETDDNPDHQHGMAGFPGHSYFYQSNLFTPYGFKALVEDEEIATWGYIDGEDFLLQSLNTSISHGNIMWVHGDESARNFMLEHLDTTWDRIYGVMLCPNITDEDEAYLDLYDE